MRAADGITLEPTVNEAAEILPPPWIRAFVLFPFALFKTIAPDNVKVEPRLTLRVEVAADIPRIVMVTPLKFVLNERVVEVAIVIGPVSVRVFAPVTEEAPAPPTVDVVIEVNDCATSIARVAPVSIVIVFPAVIALAFVVVPVRIVVWDHPARLAKTKKTARNLPRKFPRYLKNLLKGKKV